MNRTATALTVLSKTTVPTLVFAKAFKQVRTIAVGALLDEQDAFGPAAD